MELEHPPIMPMPVSLWELLKTRSMYLGSTITPEVGSLMQAQLLWLDRRPTRDPITLYINSPGGSFGAAVAITDTIAHMRTPVYTRCIGIAHSAAALILASGTRGYRSAHRSASMMTHLPRQGRSVVGVSHDTAQSETEHYIALYQRKMLEYTRMTRALLQTQSVLTPQMALESGLIDIPM